MANILTAAEAANVLRCDVADANMLALLPSVDAYIQNATGRDWTADNPVRPEAKAAARMLMVRWHEDPGGMAAGSALSFGLAACLVQLEALALALESAGVPDEELALERTNIAGDMAIDANLVLIFNHQMDAGAIAAVSLSTGAGVPVVTVNSLDATVKILTIDPTGNLTAGTAYLLTITAAADIYGQTLTTDVRFATA
jgi:hypothetical protein